MKQSALSIFLKEHGVTDVTPKEEIDQLKQKYWQSYHKEYYQERKQKHHRLTLRLNDKEYARLQAYAKMHERLSFSSFIKQSALAYQEQGYIPRDPSVTNELVKSIRKVGRVINQVVQSLHRIRRHRTEKDKQEDMKRVGEGSTVVVDEIMLKKLEREYDFLVKRVGELEQEVQQYIVSPPQKVGEALMEILQRNPSKITEVRKLLDSIEEQLKK